MAASRTDQPSTRAFGPRPPRWSPPPLRRLAVRRAFHWLVAAGLAATTAAVVFGITNRAEDLRDSYGATNAVAVTSGPVRRGEPLDHQVEVRAIPVAFLPDGALTTLPSGAVAGVDLGANTILTGALVVHDGAIAADQAAVAVPVGPTTPHVQAGQRVLIVVHADAFAGSPGAQLDGVVLSADDQQVLLVVARTDLSVLSSGIDGGGITIAIVGAD